MNSKRIKIKDLLLSPKIGAAVYISGWVRFFRSNRFIVLNDGSTALNIQIVIDYEKYAPELIKKITTGACLSVIGEVVASQGQGQKIEILATDLSILGEANPEIYPIQAKRHSMEFLREKAYLRFRTQTFGAVFRIRHTLAFAVHDFFNSKGFLHLHTPIITGLDAEGAGEMFRVTTIDPKHPPLNRNNTNAIDYTQDFFAKETHLTVSGQLEAEAGALALGEVYTFGPTFRAENSNTARHLAEFWMIEPEMAFYELQDSIELAQEFVKYLINYVLEHCSDDLALLDERAAQEEKSKPQNKRNEIGLLERLNFIIKNGFQQITYTEAIDILLASKPHKKRKFRFAVAWGVDLQSEHESYLVEKYFKKPVVVTDYPANIKAFYMKQNDDGKTVRAMDILFPSIGEIVGGSQREESYEKLIARIKQMNISEKELWWYLELRKFGTAPHSGFGLGFERLVQFVTGMYNIRDVIPFPRTPQQAAF